VDKNHDGVDDAYVVYTSDGNGQLYGALLNKTSTGLVSWERCGADSTAGTSCAAAGTDVADGATFNSLLSGDHEAPAPVKQGDKYYLMYSGTSGWVPNGGTYAVADSFLGPYTVKGTPAVGLESGSIFISQSSNIAPIDEKKGQYLYIGDQWFNPNHGFVIGDSSYVIQPATIKDGTLTIDRADDWRARIERPGRGTRTGSAQRAHATARAPIRGPRRALAGLSEPRARRASRAALPDRQARWWCAPRRPHGGARRARRRVRRGP